VFLIGLGRRYSRLRRSACSWILTGRWWSFAPAPDGVHVEAENSSRTLEALHVALQGAIALVSGRPLADIDERLKPLRLPSAGLHGLERRDAAGRVHRAQSRDEALEAGASGAAGICGRAEVICAWRTRAPRSPFTIAARLAPGRWCSPCWPVSPTLSPGFEVLEGDMVVEIKPAPLRQGLGERGALVLQAQITPPGHKFPQRQTRRLQGLIATLRPVDTARGVPPLQTVQAGAGQCSGLSRSSMSASGRPLTRAMAPCSATCSASRVAKSSASTCTPSGAGANSTSVPSKSRNRQICEAGSTAGPGL